MKKFLTVICCLATLSFAGAGDAERGFTFDLGNSEAKQTLPSWMSGQPSASPGEHATISFPIAPPGDDSDLAVTFYFTETDGGFLRVYWAGAKTGEMLSDNLFEGIAMPNQRTLLVKRATLSSPGTLNVQSSETTLHISRIHWEWVGPETVSVAHDVKQTALINATGGVLGAGEVDGTPAQAKSDQVGDSVVTANLTDKPERIEAGVEFVATLQGVPRYARLEVQMAGVPVGKPVQLWINSALAGEVAVELPDLNDPGYDAAMGSQLSYTGWRKGVIYLPPGKLKPGDNQFQFVVKDATTAAPVAVKNILLQLKYENSPDAAPATPSIIPTELTGTNGTGG